MERWMPDPTEFPEAEQERAQALIRSTEVSAPPALRARLEAQLAAAERAQRDKRPRPELPWRRERGARGPWPRAGFALPGLAVASLAAVVIVVLATSGGSTLRAPSVRSAAAIALRAPTAPAPTQTGDRLDVSAGGIQFPYWQATVGWRAVGTRTDTIQGRRVVTVFYTAPKRGRVGYSIVGGSALTIPAAQVINRRGIAFTVLRTSGATVVTWQRDGHTCVMASRTGAPQRLINLATSPA
jgi:hypothetical protein